jgi:hypothetical protein
MLARQVLLERFAGDADSVADVDRQQCSRVGQLVDEGAADPEQPGDFVDGGILRQLPRADPGQVGIRETTVVQLARVRIGRFAILFAAHLSILRGAVCLQRRAQV